MNTPEYFFHNSIRWDAWKATGPGYNSRELAIRGAFYKGVHTVAMLDAEYPGFSAAYESLCNVGCDEHLVTEVLKFCIIHAERESLDAFLLRTKLLSSVEAAVVIGVEAEALVQLLPTTIETGKVAEIPTDIIIS